MQIIERLPVSNSTPPPPSPRPSSPLGSCPQWGRAYGQVRRCFSCQPNKPRTEPRMFAEAGCDKEPTAGPGLIDEMVVGRKVAEAVQGLSREAVARVFNHVTAALTPPGEPR
jgi:hypothetical protein